MRHRNLGFFLFAFFCLQASAGFGHEHGSAPAPGPLPLPGSSVYQIDSDWTGQDGRSVRIASLGGRPTVIAMVYLSCPEACPMTIADLKRIEAALPEAVRNETRVALFSFDSKRDTPEKLREFLKSKAVDVSRWSAYHGSDVAVRKLAAVLGIRYRRDQNGDFDHSNVITVVDRDGVVRHRQIGLRREPKETAEKIAELVAPKR